MNALLLLSSSFILLVSLFGEASADEGMVANNAIIIPVKEIKKWPSGGTVWGLYSTHKERLRGTEYGPAKPNGFGLFGERTAAANGRDVAWLKKMRPGTAVLVPIPQKEIAEGTLFALLDKDGRRVTEASVDVGEMRYVLVKDAKHYTASKIPEPPVVQAPMAKKSCKDIISRQQRIIMGLAAQLITVKDQRPWTIKTSMADSAPKFRFAELRTYVRIETEKKIRTFNTDWDKLTEDPLVVWSSVGILSAFIGLIAYLLYFGDRRGEKFAAKVGADMETASDKFKNKWC